MKRSDMVKLIEQFFRCKNTHSFNLDGSDILDIIETAGMLPPEKSDAIGIGYDVDEYEWDDE